MLTLAVVEDVSESLVVVMDDSLMLSLDVVVKGRRSAILILVCIVFPLAAGVSVDARLKAVETVTVVIVLLAAELTLD